MKLKKGFVSTVFLIFLSFNVNALDVFYDAQIDAYIKKVSKPLVAKSGLKNVKFYLVKSPDINAFATNKKEIIFYSGLVNKSNNQNQIEGVMAHELGHLIAQHHVKSRVKNANSGIPAIAGTVLGLGAVIAGAPQAGYAAIVGGSAAGVSSQLSHSRAHENEADSIAIRLMKRADMSVQGLAGFFKILQREEQNFYRARPEFLNTHPSTDNRKSFIQNNIALEEQNSKVINKEYELFKAKVYALTAKPKKTINHYSIKDDSAGKSLALAIAYNYQGLFEQSIIELSKSHKLGLPKQWLYDMRGQFEYENAKFVESIKSYKRSQSLGNLSWIVDFQIAESYLSLKDKLALEYYFKALSKFKHFYYTYKRIGDYYAQNNQMTMAHYYLTTYYLKVGNKKLVKKHLELAEAFYKKENLDDEFIKQQLDELAAEIKFKDKK